MQPTPDPICVDEHAAAAALGVSVHFLRKDRLNKRRIPFFRISGGCIRYNLDRMREALLAIEEGGSRSPGRTAKRAQGATA